MSNMLRRRGHRGPKLVDAGARMDTTDVTVMEGHEGRLGSQGGEGV